jgi:signal transduction histidine kinase
MIGPETILQIGLSLEKSSRFLERFQGLFITTMPVLLVFSALIGWLMSRRALLGVEEVTRTALEISKGDLDRRVRMKGKGDEIEKLVTNFNLMLERIEALITGMREMTENLAHDLRSPITRIRGLIETTSTAGNSVGEYKAMATRALEECDHLLEMVNTMLDISEADAGAIKLTIENTDMARLVQDAYELFQPAAEAKGVTIFCKVSENSYVSGDIQRLQRMVANLLDNALKYTPPGGTVTISVNGDQGQVAISISDTGIGISKGDLPHIFTRFYRCDPSRSQGGIGLGLSLAMAIARVHGGTISATSDPGRGSKFIVILPRKSLSH